LSDNPRIAPPEVAMIEFKCPGCKQLLRVNDDHARQKSKCPKCGTGFRVPAAEPVEVVQKPPAVPVVSGKIERATKGIVIQVSARVVNWPQCCVCCMGPTDAILPVRMGVTGTVPVSVAHTQEQQAIQVGQKTWDVPCCFSCLEHGELYPKVQAAKAGLWTAGAVWGSAVMCGTLFAGLAAGTVHSSTEIIVPPLAGTAVGILAYFGFLSAKNQGEKKLADLTARMEASMRETCCVPWSAAGYLGWRGSIHTFFFVPVHGSRVTKVYGRDACALAAAVRVLGCRCQRMRRLN